MKKLQLATGLSLEINVVTEKLAFLGRTGSGKTYAAMKLAELMLEAGAHVGAIDPVGVWRALRVPAVKGGVSFPVYVFGGMYADLPLQPTEAAGALVADLVSDRGVSFVLDVSQMIPAEQQRVVRGFVERFFHRRKSAPAAIHLFMEECQEFIPENPSGQQEQLTLGAMQRLWKLGRNFGIGGSLISQRPQEIAKKALNMSGTMFAFQMTGPQERAAVKKWVADQGVVADIEKVLQKLPVGQPHVESPMYLEISRQVTILPRVTADLSSTPKSGIAPAARRELSPIDVEQLQAAMANTIEEAKANDPKELKKQLAEANQMLVRQEKVIGHLQLAAGKQTGKGVVVEKPALTDADRTRIAVLTEAIEDRNRQAASFVKEIEERFSVLVDETVRRHKATAAEEARTLIAELDKQLEKASVKKLIEKLKGLAAEPASAKPAHPATHFILRTPAERPRPAASSTAHAPRTPSNGDGGDSLTPVQERILDACAELEQLGARQPARELVAILAGYTNLRSKGFVNAIGSLRTAGYVEYPNDGTVALTDAGRSAANPPEAPRTSEEVQERIISLLGGASGRILIPLIRAYPDALERAAVASAAGYENLRSKGFVNAIGRLRTLGFVDYPTNGQVAAAPVLFLEGR